MNAERLLQNFDRLVNAPDAIPRLRRFILDLAVRGKLVPQDQNDEPAVELLKRIEAEQGPNSKMSVSETVPFDIPANWAWTRFGQLAEFSAGKTPSRNDGRFWNTGEYPWVCIRDMSDGGVISATKETVSQSAKEKVFRGEPAPVGTLLMSFKLTIGKVSRLAIPAFHNEAIISVHPYLVELDSYLFRFLSLFSMTGDTKGAIKGATLNRRSLSSFNIPLPPLAEQQRIVAKVDELMALCDGLEAARMLRETRRDRLVASTLHGLNNGGAGTRPKAPSAALSSASARSGTGMYAPSPQRSSALHREPSAASSFMDTARFYFNHLPRLTTRPEHIKQLRKTILDLAVRGKLVPQDPNDEPASELLKRIEAEKERLARAGEVKQVKPAPIIVEDELLFEVPKNWQWVRLCAIASYIQRGKSPKYTLTDGLPVVSQKCVQWQGLDLASAKHVTRESIQSYEDIRFLRDGDLLWNSTGTGTIGRIIRVSKPPEKLVCDSHVTVVRCLEVNSEYVRAWLRSDCVYGVIEEKAAGATNQVELTSRLATNQVVPLPPLPEQQRIVAKVDELMALCDKMEAQLTSTSTVSSRLLEATMCEALDEATATAT